MTEDLSSAHFVSLFRSVAPYVNLFRGKTFVIAFGGRAISGPFARALAYDANLLAALGVHLVLVHGARPQIEEELREKGLESRNHAGYRITDEAALDCVIDAVGSVYLEIGALLSQGLPDTPMANSTIHMVTGNFITTKPLGVIDGVDMQYAGSVRKIDTEGIKAQLNMGKTLQIEIVRGGEPVTVAMVAVEMDVYRPFGVLMTLSHQFTDALEQALHTPWSIVKSSVSSLSMMISGQLSARENLTGPIGIVNMVGNVVTDETQDAGIRLAQLAMLFALISVAVGFTNLLPIPPLDGNHLVILGVEGVMRKSLPEKLKAAISYVGFALIIGLAIFVVYLDVARLLR